MSNIVIDSNLYRVGIIVNYPSRSLYPKHGSAYITSNISNKEHEISVFKFKSRVFMPDQTNVKFDFL